MAVQKSRKSRSKRGMRRAHNAIKAPTLSIDSQTGELHHRHHMTATGYYKGEQIVDLTSSVDEEELEETE